MPWTQHVVDCRDHDDCTAIVCTDDQTGALAWVSHSHPDHEPSERINPHVPAVDKRGQQSIRATGTTIRSAP